MTPSLWQKPRGSKEPLAESERGEWKRWLENSTKNEDHGIQSHHFMANRWVKVEIVTDLIFLGSKIMVNSDCSYEMKKCLLLGRKAMTILASVLKSRDITLSTKVHIVKTMAFRVVMYGGESWTIKKAECWRTDAFELWCWRRLLRVPWTVRRSDQSILKEINPEYSLGGLILKLKLQYFDYLVQEELIPWKTSWCWERLRVGGEESGRGWNG